MVFFYVLIYLTKVNAVDVLMTLRDKLSKLLLGDDINAIQKILLSIGHICFKESSSTCLNVALDLIFHLCRCKVNLIYLLFLLT